MLLALSTALSGCGLALRVAYGQGPSLAFRWLDGYMDFDDVQSLRVRGALDEWFRWNRRTQLSDYADLLARAQVEVLGDVTPARMCRWADEIRARVETGLEHAAPTIVELAPTLTPQQIAAIEKKYASRNATYRDDYLQPDPAKRRRAAVEREVERDEQIYGRLSDAQKEAIARAAAASPYDAELSYNERLRRQQDMLDTLRRLAAMHPSQAQADAEFRGYLQRLDHSPNDDYRRYSARLVDYNCAAASSLQNGSTPEQRRHAVQTLRDYERDLRALAADVPA